MTEPGRSIVLVAAPDGDAGWGLSIRGALRVLREMAPDVPLTVASTDPDELAGIDGVQDLGGLVSLPDAPARRGLFGRRKTDASEAAAVASELVRGAAAVVLTGGWRRADAGVIERAKAAGSVVGVFGRGIDLDDLRLPRDALAAVDRFGVRDPDAAERVNALAPGRPSQGLGDPLLLLGRDVIPVEDDVPDGVVVALREDEAIGPAAAAALRAAGAGRVTSVEVGAVGTGPLELPVARLVVTSSPRLAFVGLARGAAVVAIERRDAAAAMAGTFRLFDLAPRTWHPGSPQAVLRGAAEQALADVDGDRRLLLREIAGGLVRHQRHWTHRLLESVGLAHGGHSLGGPDTGPSQS